MALIRWEPAAELDTIQTEMNRLFNSVFDSRSGRSNDSGGRRWLPAMDLVETADHYVLSADLPGLGDDDVKVQVEDNVLTISGERRTERSAGTQGYYRMERATGAFSRSLTLPDAVDPDSIQAHFERGVLEVTIPKPEQKKPRRVRIALGDRDASQTIDSAPSAPERDPETAATPA